MDQENPGSTVNLVVATQPTDVSFVTDSVDLKKVAKDLTKASKDAVALLVKLLESKDERVQLQAATKLVEFQIAVAKEISSDQMQRLIAEIKLARPAGQKQLIEAGQGQPQRPLVDFSTIRSV